MSRRVASVIAAIGVLKTGSATLLNSLLRLRGGKAGSLSSSDPALSFVLISCPASYASSFVLI